jgi:predicted DNA-binding protein YlxM (UPF0122 family)
MRKSVVSEKMKRCEKELDSFERKLKKLEINVK